MNEPIHIDQIFQLWKAHAAARGPEWGFVDGIVHLILEADAEAPEEKSLHWVLRCQHPVDIFSEDTTRVGTNADVELRLKRSNFQRLARGSVCAHELWGRGDLKLEGKTEIVLRLNVLLESLLALSTSPA